MKYDRIFEFDGNVISETSLPYVIAEIGVNHEGSMDQAKELIRLAKAGGASAAKFQTYKAETLASKNSPAYWDTKKETTTSQHELFKKYDSFDQRDYEELAKYCNEVGIQFLSTPFDDEAIEFLDPLMPFFKIASADLTNIPFLRKIGQRRKPVVLSTGASSCDEVRVALRELSQAGCPNICLMHCILNYPTPNENAHLRMISGLRDEFPEVLIGYSDHTLPDDQMTALCAAYSLGASMLEKHFTHDKQLPGNDHYHAMDVNDLTRFTNYAQTLHSLLGDSAYKEPIAAEAISRLNARRSIVAIRDLPPGTVLSEADLTYKRPGSGISPLEWDSVIGVKVKRLVAEDQVLQWEDLDL